MKRRLKILTRIARQTATSAPAPAPSTTNAPPTTPAVAPPPLPQFNPISGPWAWVAQRYNPNTVKTISYLLGMMHTTMHYATNGQYNLFLNQNNLGSIDASSASSVDGKNIILLAQLFYKTILNNGQEYPNPPTAIQIQRWATFMRNSQPLLNLSQLNPTGTLAQKLNLDGSLRQNLINYFGYLITYNPIQRP